MQIIYRQSKKEVNELEQGSVSNSAKAILKSPNHSLPHRRIPTGNRGFYLSPGNK